MLLEELLQRLRGIGPIVGIAIDDLGMVGDLVAVFINPEGRRP
jgi:hypothetical protein